MKIRTMLTALIATVTLAAIGLSAPASAAQEWAPAASAPIHPGVMTFTEGAQCTANFVFTDGTEVYIGQAAHCSGTGAATDTDGCDSASLPLGTAVEVDGASQPGTMVYNSWLAMQDQGETDPDTCAYNDLALVRLDPADRAKVNPSIPVWGGPVGIAGATAAGDQVLSYGNSSLRLGVSELSPKVGISLGTIPSGWSHPVYTMTPGIPGDSGSAFLDANGDALGVLSTLAIAPLAGSNNVGDIGHELGWLEAHPNSGINGAALHVQLVPGTEPFTGTGGLLGGGL